METGVRPLSSPTSLKLRWSKKTSVAKSVRKKKIRTIE